MDRLIRKCDLIKLGISEGLGKPEQIKSNLGTFCQGYAGISDEPFEKCKVCKANEFYVED